MITSCISHPAKEKFIIIRKWQIDFCKGNECAAALLSFFEYWHNFKLQQQVKNERLNTIAEMHGDRPINDTSLMQFHTSEEMEDGLLIYKRDSIRKALTLLEELNVIQLFANPNPKYKFDKTRYFIFQPNIINKWLETYNADFSNNDAEKPMTEQLKPITVLENSISDIEKPSHNNIDNLLYTHSDKPNRENKNIAESKKNFQPLQSDFDLEIKKENQPSPVATSPIEKKKKNKKVELSDSNGPLYKSMLDAYFKFHEAKTGVPPLMDNIQGAAMKELVLYFYDVSAKRLKLQIGDFNVEDKKEEIREIANNAWAMTLHALLNNLVEDFLTKQIKLIQIKSNLSNILSQIKNGNSDNKNKRQNSPTTANDEALRQSFEHRYAQER